MMATVSIGKIKSKSPDAAMVALWVAQPRNGHFEYNVGCIVLRVHLACVCLDGGRVPKYPFIFNPEKEVIQMYLSYWLRNEHVDTDQ